jgi:hypothetical protein
MLLALCLLDNFLIRYSLRHCHITDTASYTMFSCPHEPHYILSRNCTNEYFVARSICCKVDAGLDFIINEHPVLFSHLKYLIEGDDDNYFRPHQLLQWLAIIEKAGLHDHPLIANDQLSHATINDGRGVYNVKGCNEIRTNGWYQPMMLNKKAMERLTVSSKNYGLMKTCTEFDVSQDVGIGPYAWMMGLEHIYFPGVNINPPHAGMAALHRENIVVHSIKHNSADECDHAEKWPENMRYNQTLAIGCGSVVRKHSHPY